MRDFHFKHIRELVINSFLYNKKGSIHDLLVECNDRIREVDPEKEIGLRALEKHLKELREIHGYPIISYRPSAEELRKKNYSSNVINYPHKKVDIRKVKFLKYSEDFQPFNYLRKDEKLKIEEAFIILKKFVGQPGMEWLDEFVGNEDELINLSPFLSRKIQFEENLARVTKPFYIIKDSLINKYALRIKRLIRQSRKGSHELIFHPHFMKIWNNKWYVFGNAFEEIEQKEYVSKPYILPLDENIKEIKVLDNVKYQESKINYTGEPLETSYFKDIIGVTNFQNLEPEKIQLRFYDKDKFDRLNVKPPHSSWEILKENKDFIDVALNVKLNSELRNIIYKNSPGLEVLSPESLRNTIKKEISKAYSYYTN